MLLKAEQKKGREMGIMRSLKTFSIFPVIICSSLLPFCHGADSISPGQSISGNQNIISAGNNFVLGFFSAGNSQNHYIGIWFNKVSVQTVVWVANRETPITNSSSGVLKIGNDGNLILLNGNGTTVWSTNAGFESSEANTTVAELLDSGNLILKRTASSSTETPLWQSFDYPTDTFLPGMKLGLNKNTGKTWSLTSWKNRNDPSPGTYVLAMDPNRTSQFFIMQSGAPHWRSGFWNGQNFAGAPEIKRNYVYYFTYMSNDDGDRYFTYFLVDTSVISMLLMNLSGQAEQKTWDEKSEQWSSLWVQPKSRCDDYGVCGAFGTCDENALPVCDCLQGFDPQSPQDWISNNWSDGCRRRIPLKCGNLDKFLQQTRMKFPDGSRSLVVSNGQECEAECLKNCACTAYALATATECLVWLGPLTDLQVFTVDTVELYIRLEASDVVSTSAKNRSKVRRAVIIVATTILAIILLAICIVLWWRQREKERGMTDTSQELALFELDGNANTPNKHGKRSGPELPVFSFGSITLATDNFSVTNKLGEGGFGPVYKGKLPEGQEIAVKRLSRNSGQGLEEFKNEVVLIAKLQHRNLLKVLGCCIQGEEKILIYEYMPNKSLDFFLFDPTKRETLDWEKRFHIIEGIAQGLLYLHQYSRLRIIHRDLKASNILLDGEMNPKISDFGMARIFGGDQTQANTRRVVGTYGYMSPEYALDGRFSIKSDVFSFGVLLLEIISGKKNSGFYHFEQSLNLIGHAWLLWRDGRGIELIDSLLSNSCPTSSVLKCIHVGLLCVQEDAGDRPTMSSVVVRLDSQTTSLPPPKQPGFSIGRIPTEPSSSSTGQRIGSANEITISVAEGR